MGVSAGKGLRLVWPRKRRAGRERDGSLAGEESVPCPAFRHPPASSCRVTGICPTCASIWWVYGSWIVSFPPFWISLLPMHSCTASVSQKHC